MKKINIEKIKSLREKLKNSGDKHLMGLEKECNDTQLSLLMDAYLPLMHLKESRKWIVSS